MAEPAVLRTQERPNAFRAKSRLLRVSDVKGLYLGAHRERVIVVALTGGRVLLDPTEVPDRRNTVSIEEYVRYKCAYLYVENERQLEAAFELIAEYPTASSCESPRDPRCLPFSIFAAKKLDDLDTAEGRRKFAKDHQHARRSSDLADADNRLWQRQEYHSSDLIHVAGMTLPIGFHWNVQARRSTTFANGWERWDLMRGGYTNVHPDGNVRGGQRATRTYAPSSSEQPASPRLSKRVRSSRGSARGRQSK